MKTGIMIALAIALGTGMAAFAQGPSGPSTAKPIEADPKAGLPPSGAISNEAEAKRRLEAQGYRNVSQLVRKADGLWHGTAIRNAISVTVTVSVGGEITTR